MSLGWKQLVLRHSVLTATASSPLVFNPEDETVRRLLSEERTRSPGSWMQRYAEGQVARRHCTLAEIETERKKKEINVGQEFSDRQLKQEGGGSFQFALKGYESEWFQGDAVTWARVSKNPFHTLKLNEKRWFRQQKNLFFLSYWWTENRQQKPSSVSYLINTSPPCQVAALTAVCKYRKYHHLCLTDERKLDVLEGKQLEYRSLWPCCVPTNISNSRADVSVCLLTPTLKEPDFMPRLRTQLVRGQDNL